MHAAEDRIPLVFQHDEARALEALTDTLRQLGHEPPGSLDLRRIPFSGQWGLASSACLALARGGDDAPLPEGLSKKEVKKQLEARSRARAQELAESVAEGLRARGLFADVQARNGYVNMYWDTADVARRLLQDVNARSEAYGRNAPKDETLMVEYGQLNTHKQGHVGHLRNIALGDALANVLEFDGYSVIRATYIGDIGAHVIKWLWGYNKWHAGEAPTGDVEKWLESIYVEANAALKNDPQHEAEYRDTWARWERRDPELLAVWERTREWSLEYLNRLFDELGVRFDVWLYESQFEDSGREIVADLLNKGVAEIEDGAPVVNIDEKLGLEKETFRRAVLQRSDGTSLYITKELALARHKFDAYPTDRALNVVDVRQTLHFQQVFKILGLLGYEQATRSAHVPYEYVTLPTGAMASREGNVVGYGEFAADMLERALDTVREKDHEMPPEQAQQIARAVALGSIKFGMLDRENTRLLVFKKEEALDLDGFSAPYVQYAHARACRILEKAGSPVAWEGLRIDAKGLSQYEMNLLETIGGLSDAVDRSARELKPLYVVTYVYNLARCFNEFYRESPVLRAEGELRNLRLAMVHATRITLANGLRILGIHAPEVM